MIDVINVIAKHNVFDSIESGQLREFSKPNNAFWLKCLTQPRFKRIQFHRGATDKCLMFDIKAVVITDDMITIKI